MADEPTNTGTASSDAGAAGTGAADAGTASTATNAGAAASGAASTDAGQTATPATLVVPEKYELKLADGMEKVVPSDLLEKTAATARSLGLSNEKAQELLNFHASELAAREAAKLEANKPGGADWKARVEQWEQAALADAEIGGTMQKLETHVAHAKKVIGTFADDALTTFLNETGFGSNPSVIKFLSKIGRAMSEGTFVQGAAPSKAQITDPAEKLYGSKTTTQE